MAWGSKPTDLSIPESPLLDEDLPRPRFTATPDSGESPLVASFDASSSTDNVGILAYNWEFPDGSTASGITATKTLIGNGRHTVRLTVTDTDGNVASTTRDVVVSSQDPYGGTPHGVAGRIEFEDFDEGGEGVAYHDSDSQNRGGKSRTNEGVDLETCTDVNGGFNIGFTQDGEWMEYTVDVATAGSYRLQVRSASKNTNGGSIQLSTNGTNVGSAVSLPGTGGWQTWETVDAGTLALDAGRQVLRVTIDSKGSNLNWFELTPIGSGDTIRRIRMVNNQGFAWDVYPNKVGSDDGSNTTFDGLDASVSHRLSLTGVVNN